MCAHRRNGVHRFPRNHRVRTFVLAALLTLAAAAAAGAQGDYTTIRYQDGEYGLADYYATETPGAPLILAVHGGGWEKGSRSSLSVQRICNKAVNEGFACLSPDYTLSGDGSWPVQRADLAAAVAWARGVSDTVVCWGLSAGGHLALDQAYAAGGCDLVVSWSGPTVLEPGWRERIVTKLLGCDPAACPELAQDASPLYSATAAAPPTLLVHATDDATVPLSQASRLNDRLGELGVVHEFDVVSGSGHAGRLWDSQKTPTFAWIATNVVNSQLRRGDG